MPKINNARVIDIYLSAKRDAMKVTEFVEQAIHKYFYLSKEDREAKKSGKTKRFRVTYMVEEIDEEVKKR